MKLNKVAEIQFQILINESLYTKSLISEIIYTQVNEKLLKNLKQLQVL